MLREVPSVIIGSGKQPGVGPGLCGASIIPVGALFTIFLDRHLGAADCCFHCCFRGS